MNDAVERHAADEDNAVPGDSLNTLSEAGNDGKEDSETDEDDEDGEEDEDVEDPSVNIKVREN